MFFPTNEEMLEFVTESQMLEGITVDPANPHFQAHLEALKKVVESSRAKDLPLHPTTLHRFVTGRVSS